MDPHLEDEICRRQRCFRRIMIVQPRHQDQFWENYYSCPLSEALGRLRKSFFLEHKDVLHDLFSKFYSNERAIHGARDDVAGFDPINRNHETARLPMETAQASKIPVQLSQQVFAASTVGTDGMGKIAVDSYVRQLVSGPIEHLAECKKNYSLPISRNRKDGGYRYPEDDEDPNQGMEGITGDGGQKSDDNHYSSFILIQLSILAIAGVLLCLLAFFPKVAKKNEAITVAALIAAVLASLLSLETTLKRPSLAHLCGYLAALSLLLGLASLVASFLRSLIHPT